jgi:aralkylamine N-acetyltransferase
MNQSACFEVNVTKILSADEVDLMALGRLFDKVGMRSRDPSDMRKAIAASTDVYAAYVAGRLVGFGRLVSDAVYYGSIWDMAVEPDMQQAGIGSRIMDELLKCAKERGLVIIGLFTASHNQEFYERHGFEFHSDIHAMTRLPKPDHHRSEKERTWQHPGIRLSRPSSTRSSSKT